MATKFHRADEAYHAGREEGFDRGYEEGFDAARRELAGRRIPASTPAPATATTAPQAAKSTARRLTEAGVLAAIAYGAWRLLRTWPGKILLLVLLASCTGLISAGMWVLAAVVVVAAASWAVRSAGRTVADTRSGIRATRQVMHQVRARR